MNTSTLYLLYIFITVFRNASIKMFLLLIRLKKSWTDQFEILLQLQNINNIFYIILKYLLIFILIANHFY